MEQVPGISGGVPPLIAYPGRSVISNISPTEWERFLDSWLLSLEYRLRLPDQQFQNFKFSHGASGIPFLTSLYLSVGGVAKTVLITRDSERAAVAEAGVSPTQKTSTRDSGAVRLWKCKPGGLTGPCEPGLLRCGRLETNTRCCVEEKQSAIDLGGRRLAEDGFERLGCTCENDQALGHL